MPYRPVGMSGLDSARGRVGSIRALPQVLFAQSEPRGPADGENPGPKDRIDACRVDDVKYSGAVKEACSGVS